ncbi:hypothetical protein EAI_05132 [Harpegnathos saltator]|uniref:Uncharacterized protein n=1 Tax=Harpegnathos saltator TaxID=610380 RepID=E2BQ01_HARSA|nr:hypothetical protein EAI_05132 [Harpegnathos saltator]
MFQYNDSCVGLSFGNHKPHLANRLSTKVHKKQGRTNRPVSGWMKKPRSRAATAMHHSLKVYSLDIATNGGFILNSERIHRQWVIFMKHKAPVRIIVRVIFMKHKGNLIRASEGFIRGALDLINKALIGKAEEGPRRIFWGCLRSCEVTL